MKKSTCREFERRMIDMGLKLHEDTKKRERKRNMYITPDP